MYSLELDKQIKDDEWTTFIEHTLFTYLTIVLELQCTALNLIS